VLAPEEPPPSLKPVLGRKLMYIAGGACVVFLATATAVVLHSPPPAPPAQHIEAPPPPAPRELAVPDLVAVSVTVAPAAAVLTIDGEPVRGNPYFARVPRSTGLHRVQASAQGYVPTERLVSFSDNVMLDFSLSPRPVPREPAPQPPPRRDWSQRRRESIQHVTPAPPPPPIPQPALAPQRPADIVPRPEGAPQRRRAIDTNNPYGDDR
jgi:hypothetical protein